VAISWNIANVGPVATLLAQRYGTTLAVIGLFTTVLFFAELAVMVPGGRAIDRYGAKRVGLVAIAISLIANSALMLPTSPAPALALRAVAGLGVGLGSCPARSTPSRAPGNPGPWPAASTAASRSAPAGWHWRSCHSWSRRWAGALPTPPPRWSPR
jgi:MFS family permease